jgi:hypothetical protein
MKTKLTLLIAVLVTSLFMGGGAATQAADSKKWINKVYSRNMLLKKSDGNLVNVEFKGMEMKVVASTDPSLKALLGKSFKVKLTDGRYFDVTVRAEGVEWTSRWSFWPGGEARVAAGLPGLPTDERDLAVPVQDKTLEWPIAKGDEAGYQSRRNLLMYYYRSQQGTHMVSIEAVGHKIGFIRSTDDVFSGLLLSKTRGHNRLFPPHNGLNKPLVLSLNSSEWWVQFTGWGTSEWVFYPDGTAIVHERPRADGWHQVVPW